MAARGVGPKFSMSRVEAFTDGVFAIAATLLVLDLTTTGFGQVATNADLWAALADMLPQFTAFVVSFLLLSMLWVIHFRQFRELAHADTTLLWINAIRLLFVVLIPFTTSLTSQYSELLAGRLLLPINVLMATIVGYLSWVWATSGGGHLLRRDMAHDLDQESIGGMSAILIGVVATVLSPWLGPAAFLAYAFDGLLQILITRIRRRRRLAVAEATTTDASADEGRG